MTSARQITSKGTFCSAVPDSAATSLIQDEPWSSFQQRNPPDVGHRRAGFRHSPVIARNTLHSQVRQQSYAQAHSRFWYHVAPLHPLGGKDLSRCGSVSSTVDHPRGVEKPNFKSKTAIQLNNSIGCLVGGYDRPRSLSQPIG